MNDSGIPPTLNMPLRQENGPSFAISAPPAIYLPIVGHDEVFPVRRIYCVGRNYRDHVTEMGGNLPEHPIFFAKHRDCIVQSGAAVCYPSKTRDFQFEVELVVAMKSGGIGIASENAAKHVFGYAVGLDLTRRDQQSRLKAQRLPWETGKSFDGAAPCGAITLLDDVLNIYAGRIRLSVNGQVQQDSALAEMIWRANELISDLSDEVSLEGGDLIFTGTPSGVGPVLPGDRLLGEIDGLSPLHVLIGQPR
jgi:fumarylpyruvate hydrolase